MSIPSVFEVDRHR